MSSAMLAMLAILTACGRFGFEFRTGDDAAAGDATAGDATAIDALPPCASVGFNPVTRPAVAAGPRDLVIADLNADGMLDVASANGVAGSVSVLLGNGDGTFGPKRDYAGFVHDWSIAVGDLDGDGKPDLITGNFDNNSESVFINNGDGTYRAKVDYPTGTNPQSSTLGDVDGDGKLDIVTSNYAANTVSVLRGNGDGTFMAKADFLTGPGPYSAAIGDLDADGKPDLAVANQGGCGGCAGDTVTVLRGGGNGTFGTRVDHATGVQTQPWHVAIADFDRDGKPDLAVANNFGATSNAQTIGILLGNGDRTFRPRIDLPANPFVWWVAAADFDGDTRLDLVVADGSGDSVSLLIGNGDGTFQPKVSFPTAPDAVALAVGDLNKDGRPDVVVATGGATTLTVLLMTCTL